MTDTTKPANSPADTADTADTAEELTGREDGIWDVVTRDSVHQFDFDAGTVTRIPGPNARPGINDVPRLLMRIYECTVGQRGYWTMHPDAFDIDRYWQHCSLIARIERVTNPDLPLIVATRSPGEG